MDENVIIILLSNIHVVSQELADFNPGVLLLLTLSKRGRRTVQQSELSLAGR